MKRTIQIFSLLIFIFTMIGCAHNKSMFKKPNVTKEDFFYATIDSLQKWDAVILDENTSMQIENLRSDPWITNSIEPVIAWVISKQIKTLLLSDNGNNNELGVIDYFNPHDSTINTIRNMEMRLYSIDKNGKIQYRNVKKEEMTHSRLNDSISRIRFNFQENIAGKILVQQYESLYPYGDLKKRIKSNRFQTVLAGIPPHIFQNSFPLLSGKYEVIVPDYDHFSGSSFYVEGEKDIKQLGRGEITILNEKTKSSVTIFGGNDPSYYRNVEEEFTPVINRPAVDNDTRFSGTTKTRYKHKYNATKVIATVNNVMPLPNGSDKQPLGIQITRSIKILKIN